MEEKFKKEIFSLDKVFRFINEFVNANKIDDSTIYAINLAVEELFTNMVKHNSKSTNDISISVDKTDNKLVIVLTDRDVESFDITNVEEIDINQSLAERKIGGLGIHLVKQVVDTIRYEYKNRESKITLIKNLEN